MLETQHIQEAGVHWFSTVLGAKAT